VCVGRGSRSTAATSSAFAAVLKVVREELFFQGEICADRGSEGAWVEAPTVVSGKSANEVPAFALEGKRCNLENAEID